MPRVPPSGDGGVARQVVPSVVYSTVQPAGAVGSAVSVPSAAFHPSWSRCDACPTVVIGPVSAAETAPPAPLVAAGPAVRVADCAAEVKVRARNAMIPARRRTHDMAKKFNQSTATDVAGAPRQPYQVLRELLDAAMRLQAHNATALGVSRSEIDALLTLGVAPCGAAELAERLGLTRPAGTQILQRLERAGLVERIPDPDDRRRRIARPTPAAYAAVFNEVMGIVATVDDAGARLSDSERDVALDFMERARDAIEGALVERRPTRLPAARSGSSVRSR